MKLVSKDTPLDVPGVCFLCEGSPQRELGEKVIDTERVYSPLGVTHLRGRKYVCEKCAKGLAELVQSK